MGLKIGHETRKKDFSLRLVQPNGEQKLGTQGPTHLISVNILVILIWSSELASFPAMISLLVSATRLQLTIRCSKMVVKLLVQKKRFHVLR